jgi:phage terminase large subunit-like protein
VTGAELKVVAADSETVGGKKAGFVLVEELWLFGKKAGAEAMLREATGGLVSRPGGLRHLSDDAQRRAAGGRVQVEARICPRRSRRRDPDPAFLPVLYEWPGGDDRGEAYLDPEEFLHHQPEPRADRSALAWLAGGAGEGAARRRRGAADLPRQASQRRDRASAAARPLARRRFLGAGGRPQSDADLETLLARCEVVVIGGDGGGLDDLYGLCVAGREKGTDRWLYWFKAWCWPEVLERRKQIAPLLKRFRSRRRPGHLRRSAVDLDGEYGCRRTSRRSSRSSSQVKASGLLPEKAGIGLDAAMATDLIDALDAAGIGRGRRWSRSGRAYRLMSAIVGLARKLKFGGAVHSGSRMMAWCVGNAKEEQGRQSVMINKYAAGAAKIDPLMAAFNATKLLETESGGGDNGGGRRTGSGASEGRSGVSRQIYRFADVAAKDGHDDPAVAARRAEPEDPRPAERRAALGSSSAG